MNLTTLEQSKLLKAWGAPQDTFFRTVIIGRDKDSWKTITKKDFYSQYGTGSDREWYAAYDLESLIAWLGDKFSGLLLIDGEYNAFYGRPDTDTSQNLWEAYADTPLAAVFGLCRAINEKGDK